MPRPRKVVGQKATSLRILEAAETLFGTHGFAGTQLTAVAAAVGVRRPSVVHHFGSKRQLYAAVIDRAFQDISDAVKGALQLSGPHDVQVEQLVTALVAFGEHRPAAARVVLWELMAPADEGDNLATEKLSRLLDGVAALIAVGAKEAGAEPALPIRAAVAQLVTSYMVHAASNGRLGTSSAEWLAVAQYVFLPRR